MPSNHLIVHRPIHLFRLLTMVVVLSHHPHTHTHGNKSASSEHPIRTDSLRGWQAEKHYNPAAKRVPEGCLAPPTRGPGDRPKLINSHNNEDEREDSSPLIEGVYIMGLHWISVSCRGLASRKCYNPRGIMGVAHALVKATSVGGEQHANT